MKSSDKRTSPAGPEAPGKPPRSSRSKPDPNKPRPRDAERGNEPDEEKLEEELEEGLEDSFPASDPPSVTQKPR